jgi:glycerophosphoryl diester phosphodiesterase
MSAVIPRLPDLIAHRGNAAEYPENTLPAIRSALDLGVRCIAFDVQLSGDRQPILLHDSSLQRTAGVAGDALKMTLAELAEIPVNEGQRFKERFTDIGIPTLMQAVNLIASHTDATAFVQLERASLRVHGYELVVRKVCEILRPIARQCVIVSFDLPAVHHVRQVSQFRVGWMLSDYSTLTALKCEAFSPDYLFCDHQLLTQNTAKLWRGPWRWALYDVTSRQLAADLAERGARLIRTTEVRKMLREFRGAQRA